MNQIRYFTQKVVDDLRDSVESNLDWYYQGSGTSPVGGQLRVRSAEVSVVSLAGELAADSSDDAENARKVFGAMPDLTRHQASDERLWTYLCHADCADYVRGRWLGEKINKEKRAKAVVNHFFAPNSRAVFRDNGVSRLWWLGRVAMDIKILGADEKLFLEMLLYRQDVRSAVLERPFVSMNPRILKSLYEVMREHWQDEGKPLFRREPFRAWMKALNRSGGVLLLDALSESGLRALAEEEAKRALDPTADG